MKEQFDRLPKVVQDAITSADVEKQMRKLADIQKLHVDQWESLENEVMLTLLGAQPIEELETNIEKEVGVMPEVAHTLAENINKIVFEPIRQEMERNLEHPEAQEAHVSGVEAAREHVLGDSKEEGASASAQPAIAPATPPAPAPETPVERAPSAPSSGAYKPGESSTERASVHDDPYREPPQ